MRLIDSRLRSLLCPSPVGAAPSPRSTPADQHRSPKGGAPTNIEVHPTFTKRLVIVSSWKGPNQWVVTEKVLSMGSRYSFECALRAMPCKAWSWACETTTFACASVAVCGTTVVRAALPVLIWRTDFSKSLRNCAISVSMGLFMGVLRVTG